MAEDEEIGPLVSKRDKAVAVPKLKELIKRTHGESDLEARDDAVHEFRHAVNDNKPGSYQVPPRGDIVMAEYKPIGGRSREEVLKILKGPGKDMSTFDLMEEELLREPSALEKFVFKILSKLKFNKS